MICWNHLNAVLSRLYNYQYPYGYETGNALIICVNQFVCKYDCSFHSFALHCAILMNTCKIHFIIRSHDVYISVYMFLKGSKVTSPEWKRNKINKKHFMLFVCGFVFCFASFFFFFLLCFLCMSLRCAGPFVRWWLTFHRCLKLLRSRARTHTHVHTNV